MVLSILQMIRAKRTSTTTLIKQVILSIFKIITFMGNSNSRANKDSNRGINIRLLIFLEDFD